MAEELVRSWAEPKFFEDLDVAIKGLKEVVGGIVEANNAAKKNEGFTAQASTIKDVVTGQHSLVDANGKLVLSYQELGKATAFWNGWKERSNGSTDKEIIGTGKVLKLKVEEERARKASAQAQEAENKAKLSGLRVDQQRETQARKLAGANQIANDSLKKMSDTLESHRKSYYLLTEAERKNEHIGGVLQKRIQELDKQLKTADATMGKFQRNVGNYASAYNGLGNAVQQVGRELPNFAISARTGFQALTNNLPILADELNRVKAANAALRAEGKPTVSVFKQLAGAVFNWQTLLIVGITLITAYADEIGDFFSEMFKGKKAVDSMKLSLEQLNKAYEAPELAQAVSDVNELRVNIQLAKEGILDKKKVLHQYNETLGKTTGEVGSLDAAEQALVKNGDAYIKMTLYKAAAQIAFQDAAKKAIELEKSRAESEFATISTIEKFASVVAGGGIDPKVLQKRKAEKEKALEQELKAQEDIAAKFQKRTADIAKKFNFDLFGGTQDEKVKNVKDTSKADARARQKALDEETEQTLKATKGMYEKRLAIAKDAVQNEKLSLQERLTNIDKALLDEVSIVQLNGAIQHKTREEIEADITEMVLKYNKLRTEIVDKEGKEQADRIKKNLGSITGNGQGQTREDFEKEEKRKQKEKEEQLENYTQASIESVRAINTLVSAAADKRIAEIDREIEAINKKRDAEIESINASTLSATEKEKKIADAKAIAEGKTKQLEQDKITRARRAAQFQKGVIIAEIIATTALAVVKALAEGDPYTKAARAVLAGAMGAAQLAVAISAPLPAYEDGTQGKPHKGGPAVLFEGNKTEAVIENGRVWMGDKEGVYNLSRGAEVISNKELMELSRHYTLGLPMLTPQQSQGMSTEKIERGLDALKSAIENKPVAELNVTGLGMQRLSKQANQITEYIKSFSC